MTLKRGTGNAKVEGFRSLLKLRESANYPVVAGLHDRFVSTRQNSDRLEVGIRSSMTRLHLPKFNAFDARALFPGLHNNPAIFLKIEKTTTAVRIGDI